MKGTMQPLSVLRFLRRRRCKKRREKKKEEEKKKKKKEEGDEGGGRERYDNYVNCSLQRSKHQVRSRRATG